jgi:hypothetical protein
MHKSSKRICDLVSYAHLNGLGLSRRVVRNRGSIDSRREGIEVGIGVYVKVNHRR